MNDTDKKTGDNKSAPCRNRRKSRELALNWIYNYILNKTPTKHSNININNTTIKTHK